MEKQRERDIVVDGLAVSVAWKSVRRLSLRVTPTGTLAASVPAGTSVASVEEFVRRHRAWAEGALARRAGAEERRPRFEDGETLPLWGKGRTLHVIEEPGRSRGSCTLADGTFYLRVPPGTDERARSRLVDAALRRELEARVLDIAPQLEERVGKNASVWRLRRMTSRWGSCNTRTGAITLNLALAELDSRCLEGVMAHELCHLWVAAHNQEFYQRLEAACPDWREVRRELRTHEADLRR